MNTVNYRGTGSEVLPKDNIGRVVRKANEVGGYYPAKVAYSQIRAFIAENYLVLQASVTLATGFDPVGG